MLRPKYRSQSAIQGRRRSVGTVLVLMSIMTFAPAAIAQTTATWLEPVSGEWTDPTRWSTNPVYPQNGNPGGVTYDVLIEGDDDLTVTIPIVSVIRVESVTLRNALLENLSATLTISNNLTMDDATLSLRRATTGQSSLDFAGGVSQIEGTGTVLFDVQNSLGGSLLARNGTLSLGSGITVRTGDGSGRIGGNDTGGVINNGTISAQTPGRFLAIHGPDFTNNGTLQVNAGTPPSITVILLRPLGT